MENQQLLKYIQKKRASQISDFEIKQILLSSGWNPEEVNDALSGITNDDAPPLPPDSSKKTKENESMWSAFQNVLTFLSLASFAGSLHTLWSIFVDRWVPLLESSGGQYGMTRNYISSYALIPALSTLIVSAPIFIFLYYVTNKRYLEHPELKLAESKKKLNYIALVITFLVLLSRLIGAVNNLLADSLSANFMMNLAVTFAITGGIFAYYLYEVRIEKKTLSHNALIVISSFFIIIGLTTVAFGISINKGLKFEQQQQIEEMRVKSESRYSK